MFIGKYNKSVILTYMGTISAMIGIYMALNNNIRNAILCLIIAGVCDLYDGKVARMCKRDESEKEFGIQIDSLADIVAFIFLPIIICYSLGMNEWYHVVIYTMFTLGAIIRLGYFNINANVDGPTKYYSGLPVTTTSVIFPLFWLLSFCLNESLFLNIYTIMILIVSILFILNFKIKKLMGKWYIIIGLIGIVGIILVLMIGA